MAQQGKYHNWYNSARWHKRRNHQLRIEPLCRRCTALGRVVPARVANHVVPHRGSYNSFVLGELESLCFDCHDKHIRIVEIRGYDPACGADGWPIDPAHPTNVRDRKVSQGQT